MTWLISCGLQNVAIALLLAVLVWCLTRLRKNPPVAHLMWLLVLLKLITPPLISFEVWTPSENPSVTGISQTADRAEAGLEHSIGVSRADAPMAVVAAGKANAPPPVADIAHGQQSRPAASPRPIMAEAWHALSPLLLWSWIAGTLLMTLLTGVRSVRFHQRLAGMLPASQRLQDLAADVAGRMGLRQIPQVRVADGTFAPLVWWAGRRATVVLPRRMLDSLTEPQIAMVLAHELAHLRRHDHWVRVIELLAALLYWWNPMVWWVRRQLHAVEEQCCDAWVAWIYPDGNLDYAQCLFQAVEIRSSQVSPLTLASPFLNPHTLKERIEMVLKNGTPRTATRGAVLLLLIAAVLVIPTGLRSGGPRVAAAPPGANASERKAGEPKAGNPARATAPAAEAAAVAPIAKAYLPFQGTWSIESYGSLKWPADGDEARSWRWTIRNQEISWTRPGRATVRLSFVVDPAFSRDPKKWPNDIELTVLDGPDNGQKCLGTFYWFADTEVLWLCFREPGAKAGRPTGMSFNGHDQQTLLALRPASPESEATPSAKAPPVAAAGGSPLATELQVFQGTWGFGACESVLWSAELAELQKSWSWEVKGQEITWIRQGHDPVRLSFSVDPSKTPNEINFTFLDGPDQGEKCLAIYEFERNSLWVNLNEPKANLDRPTKMSFRSYEKRSMLILQRRMPAPPPGEPRPAKVTPIPVASVPGPKPPGLEPMSFKGLHDIEAFDSEKWVATPADYASWTWKFDGREILWNRPNHEPLRLSYTVDTTTSPWQIDLTFLNGPDKGEQCPGIFQWSRHRMLIWFKNPGIKSGRPKSIVPLKPGSEQTSLTLVPAEVLPIADELQALQGTWKFAIYYSDWWPERISNPPITWSPWRWTIKGNVIRWSGMKVDDVRLSFTLDPSKSPRQIDLTFLDGPHKGKKLRGIYQFYAGDGCNICFADPEANVDRPTENSYSTNEGRTMVSIEKVEPK